MGTGTSGVPSEPVPFSESFGASPHPSGNGRRWILLLFGITAALSIGIQTVGFLAYPSSWHGTPTNADRDHPRLWHWHDNEVTRCWREGVKARMW